MSPQCTSSVDSIRTVSIFNSAEFLNMYNNDNPSTDVLSHKASVNIIEPNSEFLRAADPRYRLDDLLVALLTHAPHQLGKRYVAVALHVAYGKGMTAVVDVAKLWMDHLFLPLLTISGTIKDPQLEEDMIDTFKAKVSIREEHRCAFTRTVDTDHAIMLRKRGLCAPTGTERFMATTHILPLALSYADKATTSPEVDPTCMWEIFISWTGIDPKKLVESRLNSPANAILVTRDEDIRFGKFGLYLDKEVYPNVPNKYGVKLAGKITQLSNGATSADVEFQMGEGGIEPPDPEFLAIHAAIAKVVHACGATRYAWGVRWNAESDVTLSQNRPMDFSTLLKSRLVVLTP